ncbi:MAG: hypothetical protein R3B06_11565 [Kofleriaceae bacterium]
MSTIDLRGHIQYAPGPWGLARPVAGAQLEVLDLDVGNGADTLWTGTSDSHGNFTATSTTDWRDKIRVTVPGLPPRRVDVPDPSDLLVVAVKVRADGREVTLPLGLSHGTVPAPLVVPWAPTAMLGRVDGTPVFDGPGVFAAVQAHIAADDPSIPLEMYGTEFQVFEPLTRTEAELTAWLRQRTQIQGAVGADDATVILAIAVLILAVAALTAVTLFGLAVLLALSSGYEAVDWSIAFGANGQPTLKLTLRKRQ